MSLQDQLKLLKQQIEKLELVIGPEPPPGSIRKIHQIEITSRCNLRCCYCPSRDIMAGKHPNRPAVDMSQAHFTRALEHVAHFVEKGAPPSLNLAGIGESTTHPAFVSYLRQARETLGNEFDLVFATNGIVFSDRPELVEEIAEFKPTVWVSMHKPEKAAKALWALAEHGLLAGASCDGAGESINWAGQIDWPVHAVPSPCPWLAGGMVVVFADGRISTCCLDASGAGVVGHIDDDLSEIRLKTYSLCQTCHHTTESLEC